MEKLVEQLVKENFSTANFETFCQQVIKTNETRRADEKQIEFLCSENGVEHIKQLLLSEYSEDVVNRLSINVCDRRKVGHSETLETRGKNQRFVPDVVDSNIPVDFGRNGRSIQDWVRNVLSTMCVKNLISEEEFKRLHNLEYCKQTFGIQFPLLCDNEDEVLFGKHARYWTSWKLKNKYYVCSQWWKQYADVYEHNLNRWIGKIVENANKHSD